MSFGLPGWAQQPIDWLRHINPFAQHELAPMPEPVVQPTAHSDELSEELQNALRSGEPQEEKAQQSTQETPAPVATRTPLELATSIEHGISLLKAEACVRLEDKARGLHSQVKTIHEKIKHVDELSSLISQYSLRNPDGTENTTGIIDCTIPQIATLANTLRKEGLSIPLPEGPLQRAERGHIVNVLSNHRNLLSDEQKDVSQEFQQCAVERNTLFQALMTLISELHRVKMKILGNITSRAS